MTVPLSSEQTILSIIAKFFDPLGWAQSVLPPTFLCSDCDLSNAGGMTKFLANFLIVPITNDFSMPLVFRAGILFTDLIYGSAPFMDFSTH